MNKLFRSLTRASLLVLLAIGLAAAQDAKIERRGFLDYLETSSKLTKNSPFRSSVKIQTSDYSDRDWEPYSSWVIESVFPDRSYLSYKTGRQGDFLRIGMYLYSKEQLSSPWVLSEDDGQRWVSIPSSPSSTPGFMGPIVEYSVVTSGEAGTAIKVVSKPTPGAETKDILIYVYSFDEKGVLFRQESIAFNGRRFVRRNENYEYDPTIKIEAPIK